MVGTCKYCGSANAVPILDKRIEGSPKPGNPWRSGCLDCERWLPLSNEETFREHPRPHVLPPDAGSDEIDAVVPLEEYDYSDEWADLVERVRAGDQEPDRALATDGGSDPDDDVDEAVNRFECPATGCGDPVEGKPDECPHCGASYDWENTT